jgi:predicted nucleic acid-binding protein
MRVYRDTASLRHNIRDENERAALEQLTKLFPMMLGSELLLLEAANTPPKTKRDTAAGTQRNLLIAEAKALELVAQEKVIRGFSHSSDQYGGFFACPMISDVPDETIRNELMKPGRLKQRDAEHVTLAICNSCDVILTLDEDILKLSLWLEAKYNLRAWRPSQLLKFIEAGTE